MHIHRILGMCPSTTKVLGPLTIMHHIYQALEDSFSTDIDSLHVVVSSQYTPYHFWVFTRGSTYHPQFAFHQIKTSSLWP